MESTSDSSKNDWTTDFKMPNQITSVEAAYLREVEALKYCRTMQELFLALGITSDIHDYDEHLLNICGEAFKGRLIFPDRSKIIERLKKETGDHPRVGEYSIALAAQNNEI